MTQIGKNNYTCIRCGNGFVSTSPKKANKYCSRDCYRGYKEKIPDRGLIEKVCGVCKKTFFDYSCKKSKFCSKQCSNEGRKTRPLLWRTDNKPHCVDCGKEVWYKSVRCGHCCKSGKNSWRWNGGITPANTKIRFSPKYIEWKLSVFSRDKKTCMSCCTKDRKLQAHHIKPFAEYPQLRFDINNGVSLCYSCHRKMHKIFSMTQKPLLSYSFIRTL